MIKCKKWCTINSKSFYKYSLTDVFCYLFYCVWGEFRGGIAFSSIKITNYFFFCSGGWFGLLYRGPNSIRHNPCRLNFNKYVYIKFLAVWPSQYKQLCRVTRHSVSVVIHKCEGHEVALGFVKIVRLTRIETGDTRAQSQCGNLLTLSLLMSYIYGASCKAKHFNVVYVYGPKFGNAESRLFLFAAQCSNTESMQKVILWHSCM
jgi:hypothetical protein